MRVQIQFECAMLQCAMHTTGKQYETRYIEQLFYVRKNDDYNDQHDE